MGTPEETANSTRPHLPWAGKKVYTEQIQEVLSSLWHMSADNVRIAQNLNVRTSVLNFVICAPTVDIAHQASTIIRDLSSTHIARVILLILDTTPSALDNVVTWVTLRSFPVISDLTRHSFEQITVLASGSAVRSVNALIHQLLKPDLQVYTWWLRDPTDIMVFSKIAQLSNRVIVDSASFFTPEESFGKLSTLIPALPTSAISDLNWGRITLWRQLVAQFFDAAEYKPYLAGVDAIEIEHAVASITATEPTEGSTVFTASNATRALLIAAWLKSRLGWQLSAEQPPVATNRVAGAYYWQMLRNSQPLATHTTSPLGIGRTGKLKALPSGTIDIRPRVEPDVPPGTLCLVRLSSTVDNKRATFTINRGEDLDHVVTLVELDEETRLQRTVSMAAKQDISELLHDELEIIGRDYPYEETLQAISELLS
jgi:glucose-6-phosphate dehydrogenase assembly protein OpcA